ncbi:hypothetical protein DFH09DRAFT_1102796 [Mycena vulgaris]|nr:hypothetical protein DFH09DRAFT_1102796 [Mycena vulgaris]
MNRRARSASTPRVVKDRKKYDKNDPERHQLARDVEGGPGVYNIKLKNYLLANLDPDIAEKVEALERGKNSRRRAFTTVRAWRPIALSHKVTSQHLKKRKRGSQMTTQRTKAGLGPSRIGPRRRPLGQGSARDDENVYIKDGDADAEGSTARTHAHQVPQDGFRRGRRRGNRAVAGMHDQGSDSIIMPRVASKLSNYNLKYSWISGISEMSSKSHPTIQLDLGHLGHVFKAPPVFVLASSFINPARGDFGLGGSRIRVVIDLAFRCIQDSSFTAALTPSAATWSCGISFRRSDAFCFLRDFRPISQECVAEVFRLAPCTSSVD